MSEFVFWTKESLKELEQFKRKEIPWCYNVVKQRDGLFHAFCDIERLMYDGAPSGGYTRQCEIGAGFKKRIDAITACQKDDIENTPGHKDNCPHLTKEKQQ